MTWERIEKVMKWTEIAAGAFLLVAVVALARDLVISTKQAASSVQIAPANHTRTWNTSSSGLRLDTNAYTIFPVDDIVLVVTNKGVVRFTINFEAQ